MVRFREKTIYKSWQELRWIKSVRLTGWLCAAVQFGDPADQVLRMWQGQTARCSVDPLGSADFPTLTL